MKFSFALFRKLKPAGGKGIMTYENAIFAGALFLAAVFVLLVAVDAYLFYTVRSREAAALPPPVPPATLTSQEIDEVIELIDRRAQEYKALLNTKQFFRSPISPPSPTLIQIFSRTLE